MLSKILFITHETSRTGAPFVLLHLIKWLKANQPNIALSLLVLQRGDIHQDFTAVVDTIYEFEKKTNGLINKVQKKVLGKSKTEDPKHKTLSAIAQNDYDVVYSNTIVAIPYGNKIKDFNSNVKHIVHIHELSAIIKSMLPDFEMYDNGIDHYIAASNLVKNNLIDNWNVEKSKVSRVYECSEVSTQKIKSLPKSKFTVGASGSVHWRKGSDLFLQVARYIKANHPEANIEFVWVGSISAAEKIIMDEDLRKTNLNNMVSFVGLKENPADYYNNFDVFLMTSREDPFPLVCIEVGMLAKPIICFDNATGSQEIIEEGGGFVVPYLSIEAMAEKVMLYYNDQNQKEAHGNINATAFSKFTPQQICPLYFEVIQKMINE